MNRIVLGLALGASVLTLASCGMRGGLERPPPPMNRTTGQSAIPQTTEAEEPADQTPGIGGAPSGVVRPPSF